MLKIINQCLQRNKHHAPHVHYNHNINHGSNYLVLITNLGKLDNEEHSYHLLLELNNPNSQVVGFKFHNFQKELIPYLEFAQN
jgi:hypothetical protein